MTYKELALQIYNDTRDVPGKHTKSQLRKMKIEEQVPEKDRWIVRQLVNNLTKRDQNRVFIKNAKDYEKTIR